MSNKESAPFALGLVTIFSPNNMEEKYNPNAYHIYACHDTEKIIKTELGSQKTR